MHHSHDRRMSVPVCASSCINRCTHTYAYHTIFEGGSDIITSCTTHWARASSEGIVREIFLMPWCADLHSVGGFWSNRWCRTRYKPRLTHTHRLFGLFAAGQHKHPMHSGWGTACENKHAQRHIFQLPLHPSRSMNGETQDTGIYLYIYIYILKKNWTDNLKATKTTKWWWQYGSGWAEKCTNGLSSL